MESNDCSRSQGHPPGARKRAMMDAAWANNAAARAGSVAMRGVESDALELTGGRSMHLQFSVRGGTAAVPTRSAVHEENRIMRHCVDGVYSLLQ